MRYGLRRVVAAESDSVASVIHKVIVKEQLEFAVPEMYRLVRCGNQSVTRDGSEPVRATLPRSGVVDVLTRTVEDYAIVEGDILAMQVSGSHLPSPNTWVFELTNVGSTYAGCIRFQNGRAQRNSNPPLALK